MGLSIVGGGVSSDSGSGTQLPQTLSGVDTSGLVARWLLDGSLADQVSARMLVRAGTWNTSSYNMRWDVELGQYVPVFTGANYYTFSPTGFPSGAAAGSMSCWVKLRGTDTIHCFGYGAVSALQIRTLAHVDSLACSDYQNVIYSGVPCLYDGLWHHVALTYNGATTNLYVDGIISATLSVTLNTVLTSGAIGAFLGGIYTYVGYIADCRIYSEALSASRVELLAQGKA